MKFFSVAALIFIQISCSYRKTLVEGIDATIVHGLAKLDFVWPNEQDRKNAIRNGSFIVENNLITGIKTFRGRIYVSVPRWRDGVPSTLNEIVMVGKTPVLKPFPSWSMQQVGNCYAFQYVQSMEIDLNTGYMWIIDTGRTNTFSISGGTSQCNAKIVIIDTASRHIVSKHVFPDSVVSKTTNFLNDLVIDYVQGKAKYAYISDTGTDPKIVVYDFANDKSYFFRHSSMQPLHYVEISVDDSIKRNYTTPVDGIAMSPDFKFVYYCTLADKNLFRIPTFVLRTRGNFNSSFQLVGEKESQTDGMIFSQNALYYGGLGTNMVYRHRYQYRDKVITFGADRLFSGQLPSLEWVDGFAIDEHGSLWFVANRMVRFFSNKMNFHNTSEINMYIWKVNIKEQSYLWRANVRTAESNRGTSQTILSNSLVFIGLFIKNAWN